MLFGSVARNEATAESDIDFLVEFRAVNICETTAYLEKSLDCSVDLKTTDSLKSYLQEPVLEQAVRAL